MMDRLKVKHSCSKEKEPSIIIALVSTNNSDNVIGISCDDSLWIIDSQLSDIISYSHIFEILSVTKSLTITSSNMLSNLISNQSNNSLLVKVLPLHILKQLCIDSCCTNCLDLFISVSSCIYNNLSFYKVNGSIIKPFNSSDAIELSCEKIWYILLLSEIFQCPVIRSDTLQQLYITIHPNNKAINYIPNDLILGLSFMDSDSIKYITNRLFNYFNQSTTSSNSSNITNGSISSSNNVIKSQNSSNSYSNSSNDDDCDSELTINDDYSDCFISATANKQSNQSIKYFDIPNNKSNQNHSSNQSTNMSRMSINELISSSTSRESTPQSIDWIKKKDANTQTIVCIDSSIQTDNYLDSQESSNSINLTTNKNVLDGSLKSKVDLENEIYIQRSNSMIKSAINDDIFSANLSIRHQSANSSNGNKDSKIDSEVLAARKRASMRSSSYRQREQSLSTNKLLDKYLITTRLNHINKLAESVRLSASKSLKGLDKSIDESVDRSKDKLTHRDLHNDKLVKRLDISTGSNKSKSDSNIDRHINVLPKRSTSPNLSRSTTPSKTPKESRYNNRQSFSSSNSVNNQIISNISENDSTIEEARLRAKERIREKRQQIEKKKQLEEQKKSFDKQLIVKQREERINKFLSRQELLDQSIKSKKKIIDSSNSPSYEPRPLSDFSPQQLKSVGIDINDINTFRNQVPNFKELINEADEVEQMIDDLLFNNISVNPNSNSQFNSQTSLQTSSLTNSLNKSIVSIVVRRAYNLNEPSLGACNPYVVIDWDKLGRAMTQSLYNTTNPVYDSILKFKSPLTYLSKYLTNQRRKLNDNEIVVNGSIYSIPQDDMSIVVFVYSRNDSVSDELLADAVIDSNEIIEGFQSIDSNVNSFNKIVELYDINRLQAGYVELQISIDI